MKDTRVPSQQTQIPTSFPVTTARPTPDQFVTKRPDFVGQLPQTALPSTLLRQKLLAEQKQKDNAPIIHNFDDPEVPQKRINNEDDMKKFRESQGYKILDHFIRELNQSMIDKKISDLDESKVNPIINKCVDILDQCERWIDEYPISTSLQNASRYGNIAFRDWFGRVCKEAQQLVNTLLSEKDAKSWKAKELCAYFKESFGNIVRIDYGTGHETAFCSFMCCLARLNLVTKDDAFALVAKLFNRYLKLMRHVQLYYKLEPAGSHGVWGLDDYYFLPFLWGAAQLVNHEYIVPNSIHDKAIVDAESKDYLYLAAIQFINQVKKGYFGEHSPLLNDISGSANWSKINNGMIKMYHDEVLGKYVVIQHYLFGKLIPFVPVETKQ
ncbi:hypothetical protein AKO1_006196 [Acrasis kona]|uniref:Serine/threonine-protein phosphatase 2A activator n=1 Tax=Acrasis kona TaxID=1008807 RepID=A0AAW2YI89_9EUKA